MITFTTALVATFAAHVNGAAVARSTINALSFDGLGLISGRGGVSSCGLSGPASCQNTTVQTDTCCFEAPGGMLAHTQFWDTDPVTGPSDSWTIHGLWPDYCTTGYPQDCDPSRNYANIGNTLKNAGRSDLVEFMTDYMQSNNGSPESFWQHEWSKHGTCVSTLRPKCMPPGSGTGADAAYYFHNIVTLFKSLPTYEWLKLRDITPGTSRTWSSYEITSALKAQSGYTPAIDCNKQTGEMYQIYWYFNLKGSMIDGTFIPIDAPRPGSCPKDGIKYLPKPNRGNSPVSTTTKTIANGASTTATTNFGTSTGVPTKGFLRAGNGCLISRGTWSTQTCATFTFTKSDNSIALRSSKGPCGIVNGAITCGNDVAPFSFSSITSGGNTFLTYAGSPAFSADGAPSGSRAETVYTGSSHTVGLQLAISSS